MDTSPQGCKDQGTHSDSPGAPCCGFLKSQLFTLRLVNLVHGAVPQLTHQLQYNREGMKCSGEELPLPPRGPPRPPFVQLLVSEATTHFQ